MIRLKQEQPGMRFRLENNACTKDVVCTAVVGESGLEAPDEFSVELDAYRLKYGDPSPEDITFDEIDGVKKAGVSWQLNQTTYCFFCFGCLSVCLNMSIILCFVLL